ncbi:kelch-like protein 42 [Syngnathoides biaculeatus]|uniref:kelch-like protein 42 n=1 Tax=Syngnathoides biaculeatus TaxID=300417 RepID=UPI002ADE330C|nr:kelch-like protein 42 [Syngnathoides biaculeatus]XP_061679854.1 kelch-like protein 42 [Syngnathoides biaculeatus]
MNFIWNCFGKLLEWISLWMKYGLGRLCGIFPRAGTWTTGVTHPPNHHHQPHRLGALRRGNSDRWKSNMALRTYDLGGQGRSMVTVQTSTHAFRVDLGRLSECSEYFRALSQSGMREVAENLVHLDHVSSSVFHHLLEFYFHDTFEIPQGEELGPHIQVSGYLLAEAFLAHCLSVLERELRPERCLSYLSLAREICCVELRSVVFAYLSRNLLELPRVVRCLSDEEREELIQLRTREKPRLCGLRKENLTSWQDPATERARHIFAEQSGAWLPVAEFPFRADKWCFTAVVLYNYLYIVGGYRTPVRRRWDFKIATFRYNPLTREWTAVAPLIKHRRHFAAVACQGRIYAVGGWYLDSLVTPDSSTALYTAVECYDPWENTWRLVSPLPLSDFQFTVSLSHDVPLTTSLGHCLYVLGNIQRTGEKLLLQYDTRQDLWRELLPTLSRADADLPALYFLGASDDLLVIGGNNWHNVVTSFCVGSRRWAKARTVQKLALAGQGALLGEQLAMPSAEHDSVLMMDVQTLALKVLPPLPIPVCYEAIFYLHF